MEYHQDQRLRCEKAEVSLEQIQLIESILILFLEAVVRFTNNSPTNSSVHVHGQYNRAPFDGWADDYANPDQYKDYYYPNAQNARSIWYHDHTARQTGENVYMGLYGFYLLTDEEEQALGLPAGDYDIPLALSAKQYAADGSLFFDTHNNTGLWGDVIHVNGQPWPYMNVEPRKYRFRILDGSVSRSYDLYLQDDETEEALSFDMIASDGGTFASFRFEVSLTICQDCSPIQ